MATKRNAIMPGNAHLDIPRTYALPYAMGVRAGGFVFLSGMSAVDPASGERAHGTVASETRTILSNMDAILREADSSLAQAVKTTVWLHSLLEQEDMNDAYRPYFPDAPPARTVCGARINYGMKVQIDCIALAGAEPSARLERTVHVPKNPMLNVSARQARPHSPCIRIGDLVFVSGNVPISPETGERTQGPIADQVATVLANIKHLLESNGWSLDNILRFNITLADLLHADDMWRVFHRFFPDNPPAATLIGMQLSFGNLVEIECVAHVGER